MGDRIMLYERKREWWGIREGEASRPEAPPTRKAVAERTAFRKVQVNMAQDAPRLPRPEQRLEQA